MSIPVPKWPVKCQWAVTFGYVIAGAILSPPARPPASVVGSGGGGGREILKDALLCFSFKS